MSTRIWPGLLAMVLLAAGCSDGDGVRDKSGTVLPDDHDGEGGSGGSGDTGGTGGDGPLATPRLPGDTLIPNGPEEGPWPVEDVVHYAGDAGLPGTINRVGVDDAQNVYVIANNSVYAARAGVGEFVRTNSGGQFDTGHVPYSICGGGENRVYVGYLTYEAAPEDLTEEEKLLGDMDRFVLQEDGTLSLEFHHRMQNSKAKWMDHTRLILDCARVIGGPNHGDLYVASNHGVTLVRGDEYADHRHAIWNNNGSQAIGYNWGINVDIHGNALWAGHWKLAAVGPAPLDGDLIDWIDHHKQPWLVDTWPEHWGPVSEAKDMHAIAGDIQQERLWVGAWGKGLAEMQFKPRVWRDVPDTPDTHINSLELDPTDGKLWVGTRSAGLWRWDTNAETWEKHPLVPADTIHDVYLDLTVAPRAVYVATNRGLYVLRGE